MSGDGLQHLENCLNRLLELDEDTAARLGELSGRVVAIELSGTGVAFRFVPEAGEVRLYPSGPREPDVTIRGRPLELLRYMAARHAGRGGVHIEIAGDVDVAQRLQQILGGLDPDWEEVLSQWVGDTLARKLRRGAGALLEFGREARSSLSFSLSEYLRYERQLLVDRSAADAFVRAVDDLRDDAERVRARLALVDRHLQQG